MTRHSALVALLSASLIIVACGGEQPGYPGSDPEAPTWTNRTPVVVVASPDRLAVGESVTVLGQHFVGKAHGKVLIRFKGTFFDDNGGTNPVDFQATPEVVNSGKLRWKMWPNIVFAANGDQLGRFVGHVVVLNLGNDGSHEYSDPAPLTINIKPSIIPRAVRPMNAGCASVVTHTLEKQPMSFAAEVVGLRPGTTDAPLTFYWTFLAEQWDVNFNWGTMDPGAVVPKSGAVMLEDTVTSGRASSVADGGSRSYMLKILDDLRGSSRLKELKTGAIDAKGNNMPVTVNVAAVDASGKSAHLTINLTVHRKADMHYDGQTRIAERFAPVMVSDCMPGGDIGRDVNYHESTSESRARSLGFNWNAGVGGNIAPIPSNPFALGINFSLGFGVNVQEHVSSDKSKSLSISGHILPGEYGAFYRQTTKIHRIAKLVSWTACGQSIPLGDVVLTDWMFTPDLASGSSCPPQTKLQPAQKFVE